MVHVLSPNIYRNTSEALESFEYITSNGKLVLAFAIEIIFLPLVLTLILAHAVVYVSFDHVFYCMKLSFDIRAHLERNLLP